ncbi:hybrid sensor histidine kinase/response regulator [Halochromatium glycolicum]|nr:hybrid sensor histidine kinase/response regulator [Halochromatium glycolicum]
MNRLWGALASLALLVLILLAPVSPVSAADGDRPKGEALRVVSDQARYSTIGHLELLSDPDGSLTLEAVRSAAYRDDFVPTTGTTPNLGFERSVVWARLRIDNRLEHPATYYLDLAYPLLDWVSLYIVSSSGVTAYHTGDREPFSARPVAARTFLFPVQLQPSQPVTVYLRVETVGSLNLPLDLLSQNAAFEHLSIETGMLALYYGALLMLVIYNLYHAWRLQDVNAANYAAFILGYIAFQLALNGLSFQFFWPNHPWWANVSLPIFLCVAYLLGVRFSRSILDTATKAPQIHRVLGMLRWPALAGIPLALFGPYDLALPFAVALVFTVVLFIAAGFKISLQGYRPARYYSLAWTVFLGSMFIYALTVFGVLPTNFFTTWVTQFGSVWQAVILAFTISDRFYLLEEQRRAMQTSYAQALEEANDELNAAKAELEDRVEDRTQELTESNTQLREQKEVLRIAERKADAANRAKSEFLANMSHEIRTPMNAIVGFLHLLSESRLEAVQRDYVDKAERAARALMHLIRDLLDFSKIDVGRLELEAAPFDVGELVTEARDLIALAAREKGLELRTEQRGVEGCWVVGDQARLRQVLVNLLHNAVKFTPSGEVCLEVACEPGEEGAEEGAEESRVRLEMTVRDTGIGIAEEQRKGLFRPFTQADASITRRFGGTGLGLSISQRLVQQMGGEIALESQLGVGSRFSFSLSLPMASPQAGNGQGPVERVGDERLASERPLQGMRVLVVEDQPLNQEVIAALLQRGGAQPLIVSSGIEALARLRAREAVDVVLMDLQMPQMDGYETAERIRSIPGYAQLPIIAVTAHAGASERKRCLEAGFHGHLAKPVDHRQLLRALQRLWRPAARRSEGLEASEQAPDAVSQTRSLEAPVTADLETRTAPGSTGTELAPGLSRPDDGETGAHRRRLRRFAEHFGEHPAMIRASLEAGERTAATEAAHTLAGVALTLGIPQVGIAARQLEHCVDVDRVDVEGEAACAALESAMRRALESIASLDIDCGLEDRPEGQGAIPETAEPMGRAALRAELLRLDGLLAGRNLRARVEVEQLVQCTVDAELRPLLDAVGERVRRFDFDGGRIQLSELLARLGPGEPAA